MSYTIETALSCFALNLLIKTLGSDQLGRYFAYSALLCICLVLLSIYASRAVSAINRFISLHIILGSLALLCLLVNSVNLQARILFLTTIGFNLLIYFSNWSVVSVFITPFESKRLFPRISSFGQAGVFLGALFAMASRFGFSKTHYFVIWLAVKILMIALGFFLRKQAAAAVQYVSVSEIKRQKIGIFQILRSYRLVPRLTFWVFIWGVLFTSMLTRAGATFDKSGVNLTVLYGALSLGCALIASFSVSLVYPKIVRKLRLETVLFVLSLAASMSGGLYLVFDLFGVAIFIYLLFSLIDGSFVVLALSSEFSLYPSNKRDQIRLLGEILAQSAGVACVGLVFALPQPLASVTISILFLALLTLGFICRREFIKEVTQFLKSMNLEEQDNAIALFDMLEDKESYSKILDILLNGRELPARINVLNTFASLGAIKPVPQIIKLLKASDIDPLRIAILRYLGNIKISGLDPFLSYQLFEILQEISRSCASNILRAMAMRLWLQYGPLDKTVGFIMSGLEDKDERVVANAIEGLNFVNYPGIVEILSPFLEHKVSRIRANCIVTLWKYEEVRDKIQAALGAMLISDSLGDIISGVWAVGEVRDKSRIGQLSNMLPSEYKELQRGVPIALLKLGCGEYYKNIVELILAEDEKQAINVCYLSLRIDERILNERIIAAIYEMGHVQRELAIRRYSQCGGFCREQLGLLSGKRRCGGYLF